MSINAVYISYSPLDQSQESLRIIDLLPGSRTEALKCRIRHVSLTSDPKYSAVSYTWGKKTRSTRLLWLDGRPCHARPSLWAMLQALRDPHRTLSLWIDAFCIDQSNIPERNHQVHMMDKIYQQASSVIAWLGHRYEDSDLAIDFMNAMDTTVLQRGQPQKDIKVEKATADAICLLCYRDYWFRAWIRQEIILARDTTIYCGNKTLPWHKFVYTCRIVMPHALGSSPVLQLIQQQSLHNAQKLMCLQELLKKYGYSKSSDVRDRVYALLPLASDCANGQGLVANYSLKPAQLYHQVLEFCQPEDPLSFGDMLQDILVPNKQQVERLQDLQALEKCCYHINNPDLGISVKELMALVAQYSAPEFRARYLHLKAVVVWKIISLHFPSSPLHFSWIFEGLHTTDKTPPIELERSRHLQNLQDQEPVIANKFDSDIYNILQARLYELDSIRDSRDPSASHSYSLANSLFWRIMSTHLATRINSTKLVHLLESIFSISEAAQLGQLQYYMSYVHHHYYYLVWTQLCNVLASVPPCCCRLPSYCTVDRAAMIWEAVMVIWPYLTVVMPISLDLEAILSPIWWLFWGPCESPELRYQLKETFRMIHIELLRISKAGESKGLQLHRLLHEKIRPCRVLYDPHCNPIYELRTRLPESTLPGRIFQGYGGAGYSDFGGTRGGYCRKVSLHWTAPCFWQMSEKFEPLLLRSRPFANHPSDIVNEGFLVDEERASLG